MSTWDWTDNSSTSGYITISNTSGSGTTYYPQAVYYPPPQLPGVLESPSNPLTDREWLDAQIAEVCDLAVAA